MTPGIWTRMVYGRVVTGVARIVGGYRMGVTADTLAAWHAAGIQPERNSPMHTLMIVYDDAAEEVKPIILKAARQIHALTPLACCRHEE